MVQLKGIDKALPGLAAQVGPNPNRKPDPHPNPNPDPNPNPNPNPDPDPNPNPDPHPNPNPGPHPNPNPGHAAQANILALCAKGTMSYDTLVSSKE